MGSAMRRRKEATAVSSSGATFLSTPNAAAGRPPPRGPGVAAAASHPLRRPSGGDLPPGRLPRGLARASAACASFRRLITGAAFLQRYRSLHPPLFLGFIDTSFHPAEAPHPNATAARSISPAGFSFDYLPPTRCSWSPWDACDVRDGRVLVVSRPIVMGIMGNMGASFPDPAVCDPLFRRYRLLPPIPYGLLVSVHVQKQKLTSLEAFLIPGDEEDGASFRVIGRADSTKNKSLVFVFSSGSGLWSVGTTWDALNLGDSVAMLMAASTGK
nr:unnamed protein product [Digitaria exilis]